jgi:hypothetical protein
MELPLFKTVFVRCQRHDSMLVRWILAPTAYPLEDIEFEVFRSMSVNGPWDFLATVESGSFSYFDFDIEGPHAFRNFYYIVRIADKNGKGFRDSAPEVLTHDPDNIALEMVRKKNVFLTVRGGIRGGVLVRKRWGSKCARCWSKERQVATDRDCPICYGTGYSLGFCNPVLTPAAMVGPTQKEYVEIVGKVELNQSAFEISNMPLVDPYDVFIDTTIDERYEINRVTAWTHRGYIVSQIIVCTRLDDNDIRYNIKMPVSHAEQIGQSFNLIKPTVR